ncbi:MAG: ATP-binding cassette domain-containing protein, partial [Acidobacteria bacterium]|nr:ATP-binding cassette domain-containing protein [Acidobacteriota bacterium]
MMPTPHRTRTGLPLEARNGRPNHPPEAWTLGRDVGNDLVIDHPLVSRHHARIRRGAEGFVLEDLGSTNGTFVDGRRSLRTVLRPGDRFSVASQSFYLDQSGEPRRYDQDRSLTLEAAGLRVDKAVGRHRVITLIDGISLTIGPSQVVGLMGPSGSGKTTLLESLNGYLPPSAGQVLLNQRDLYEHFDRFRLDIGYVPQDDILHSQLRVRDALFYSARLRLPPDTRNREIDLRIERVLDQLGLAEVADRRIGSPADKDKVLSGGQRKRVNMALELLTEPWLLFLDEPTSGLSSADALQVLRVLRRLADQGRTVVLSIHQPSLEVFRQMTHVAMLAKDPGSPEPARLAYFGPAFPDSLRFFNRDLPPILDTGPPVTPEILFDGLQKHSTAEWVRRFAASPYAAQPQRVRRAPQGPGRSAVARDSGLHQWWSLLQRDLAIKRRD